MSAGTRGTLGKTRTCPHCRASILESASICPACRHHLRFTAGEQERAAGYLPFRVEGTVRHPAGTDGWEYSVLVTISDEQGAELARHVVGVGALESAERRTFTLAVEVFPPSGGAARGA